MLKGESKKGTLEETEKSRVLAVACRVFSNPDRLRMMVLLGKKPHSFSDLLKELSVNPKVLNDHLNLLAASKLLTKSYPYGVYTLTPAGRVMKQGLETLAEHITKIEGAFVEG